MSKAGRRYARLATTKKPPESSGFFADVSIAARRLAPLEPFAPATPVAVAIHAGPEAMVPAAPRAVPHMGQEGEAAFLAVVPRLVERVSRVCHPLHAPRRRRHGPGASAPP